MGPSLASFGVPAPLANPTLYLFDHTGALIAANDNWKDTQQAQIQATGLAPPNNLDAAILITLSPGAYTVFLQGKAMATGIGLAEVYDVDPSANAQPTNLSARAFVGTGNDVLIGVRSSGGNGASLQRALVRALGPSLASTGIATPLAIRRSHRAMPTATSSLIMTTGRIRSRQLLRRLARHLRTILNALLAPGNYTAIVAGKNGTTGVALIEFYSLP